MFLLELDDPTVLSSVFIRRLPYAVRSSTAILKQIKGGIEEAAIVLDAPPGVRL